jgi:protoporphyrinogen oxidase
MTRQLFKAIVVGAGPAGLTAAYKLSKGGLPVLVLESDPQYVGGISRTVDYKGFGFDIGGHRFFSKSREVEDLWTEIAGANMLNRRRSSRIYYRGQYFAYPLKPIEALAKLGLFESAMCMLSFLRARFRPKPDPKSFEDWVSNQFGRRLFRIFFKTYTEKVWGMRCSEISADWAVQRIQGLSLGLAIKHALLPRRNAKDRKAVVKTLIGSFRYPRRGPGMMWEACAEKIRGMGGQVLLGRRVESCRFDSEGRFWTVEAADADGRIRIYEGEHLISSIPVRELVAKIEPRLPAPAVAAAQSLRYRDFLTVGLILPEQNRITDNWIYLHDPNIKAGRIQYYKSWSPEMVPDAAYCSYGVEYFCFEGDGLWDMADPDLIALAKREIEHAGLGRSSDVTDGCVIRQRKAYPVYDHLYAIHVETVRQELERHCGNIHLIGRNGMHKYNNQDHAMMTAMLTAKNIIAGENRFDVWQVNQDAEYHESGGIGAQSAAIGLRAVPGHVR